MSRWQPNARTRLETAALQLFTEKGFAETTVPEIAARAGLTTRTFFRHFADKREVLFADEDQVPAFILKQMAEAPLDIQPTELMVMVINALAAQLFSNRYEYVVGRKAVIEGDKGVQERELLKLSAMADLIAAEYGKRGVDKLTAQITARMGVMAFNIAVTTWLEEHGARPLEEVAHETLRSMAVIASSLPPLVH